jgi:hypothetical protein
MATERQTMSKPTFYECGICGAMHNVVWHGDCRQDDARFDCEALDEKFGRDGWEEVEQDEV